VILEGSIIAYETNVRTGGEGARYFGIGGAEQYREDQVTINLRAVDVRTGRILHSVMTTKKILSQEITSGVYRFIEFKRLLEMEAGQTTNEPSQLCVLSAIEHALIHLISEGVLSHSWALADPNAFEKSVLGEYARERRRYKQALLSDEAPIDAQQYGR
jgi:curli production assembly/transport component CsgG